MHLLLVSARAYPLRSAVALTALLRGSLTMIATSHQEALVRAADRVFHLQDGVARLLRDGHADDSAADGVVEHLHP